VTDQEDDRWKTWWNGDSRPFIVLTAAQVANADLLAELDAKFPGVDVRLSEYLPTN
jgi:hypothetical protein